MFFFKISMKKGLDDAKITLCVSICVPSSQARVTSEKSLSFLNPPKAEFKFSWKSFHLRQSFSEVCILGKHEVIGGSINNKTVDVWDWSFLNFF